MSKISLSKNQQKQILKKEKKTGKMMIVWHPHDVIRHARLRAAQLMLNAPSPSPAQTTDFKTIAVPTQAEWSRMNESLKEAHIKALKDSPEFKTLRDVIRGAGRSSLGHLKVWLWYSPSDAVSSANTIQSPVNRIRASDSAEFASLAALYDEYKMTNSKSMSAVSITLSSASISVDGVVAYDPVNSGAYTTVTAALSAAQHVCWRNHNSNGNPLSITKDGFHHFNPKFPKGYQYPGTGNTGPDVWIDTGVTSADAGHFKFVIDAATTAVTTTLRQYIGVCTEFRVRS
jgi:hypothetical protein